MLELMDTGRMAYKLGKWRGLVHMAYALATFLFVNLISALFAVLPGSPQPPQVLQWVLYGLLALAVYLWCYGMYRVYRDHSHHDYEFEADRYKQQGW